MTYLSRRPMDSPSGKSFERRSGEILCERSRSTAQEAESRKEPQAEDGGTTSGDSENGCCEQSASSRSKQSQTETAHNEEGCTSGTQTETQRTGA